MNDPKLLVALDFDDRRSCLELVEKLDPAICRLKIGKELFTLCGPAIVHDVQKAGFEVFLDLKFHDIPNTVAKAVAAAAKLGVWMVNVHASGGARMLDAAREALVPFRQRPLLIAVTVLTSMNAEDLAGVGIEQTPEQHVKRLALLAKASGLDGVVSSAWEVATIKQQCGMRFVCVTPGIRLPETKGDDQRRVMTPVQAIASGADYLVMGRPITETSDPAATLRAVHESIVKLSKK